jgi:hypothetical protein
MEWYAIHTCQGSLAYTSLFGAVELVAVCAVFIFDIAFKKPEKRDK